MAKKFDFKKIGMRAAGVSAGAVGGKILSDSVLKNANPKIVGFGKIIVGAILPELMPKNEFMANMGAGLTASGAVDTYGQFAGSGDPVNGIGDPASDLFDEEQYTVTEMSGMEDSPISGDDSPLSGIGEEIIFE